MAFVTNEELAWEFCDKHKDCYYHEIHITKYRNELEAKRGDVPTCENCKHLSTSLKGNPICRLYDGLTELDDYCNEWDYDE